VPQTTPITLHQQLSASTRDVFPPIPQTWSADYQNPEGSAAGSPDPGALRDVADTRGLYIHVPFCFHKCHYCDFYSFVDSRDRQAPFTDALIRQLETQAPHAAPLRTIFVGGGTPSLLRTDLWERLLRALDEHYELSELEEFTVECNPETVTDELMGLFAEGVGGARVSRVSVGAQSFDPAMLKALERWHEPENVARSVELAQKAGIGRRSVDLIYAIPGQTLEGVREDLRRATSLPIDHVSAYALTYEPNTAMTKRLERGRFEPADEDLEAEMFDLVHETLAESGFERYEVSNFARAPASRSRHNLAYWRQEGWLAAGPSASGHHLGARWKNVPRLTDWMEACAVDGHCPVIDHETADPKRALAERLMTGLRLSEGVPEVEVLARAEAIGARASFEKALGPHVERGWATRADNVIRLTDAGMRHADGVASDLIVSVL